MRVNVLLSPFDRAQRPVCGEKAGSSHLKYHIDRAAWVLPGELYAMKNCDFLTEYFPICRVGSPMDSLPSSGPLAARNALFVAGKAAKSPEIPPLIMLRGASFR